MNESSYLKSHKICIKLHAFIDKTLEEQEYEGSKQITYDDLWRNSKYWVKAALFSYIYNKIKTDLQENKNDLNDGYVVEKFWTWTVFLAYCSWVFIFLRIHRFRINGWLWHIQPVITYAYWADVKIQILMTGMNKFYNDVCWYPKVEDILVSFWEWYRFDDNWVL